MRFGSRRCRRGGVRECAPVVSRRGSSSGCLRGGCGSGRRGHECIPSVVRSWTCRGGWCGRGRTKRVPTPSSGRSRGRWCGRGRTERVPVPSGGGSRGSRGRGSESVPSPVGGGSGGSGGTESTPASVGGCGCCCRCDVEQVKQASTRGGSRGSRRGSCGGRRRDGSSTSVSPDRSVPGAVRVHLAVVLGPDVLLDHGQRRARGFRPGGEARLPVRVRAVVTHRLHVHHLLLLPRVQRRGAHERYVHTERAVDARAVRADEDAEVDGRPARLARGAVGA